MNLVRFNPLKLMASAIITFFFIFFIAAVSRVAFGADGDLPVQSVIDQVLNLVKAWGGLPWAAKIAACLTVLISLTKVSFIRPYWDKLGALKTWIAPILALVVGVLSLSIEGKLSLPGVMAYLFAGAGAIILHELLDSLKKLPGLGAVWVSIIEVIEKLLGGSGPKAEQAKMMAAAKAVEAKRAAALA
jgi:hypothetical protein